MVVSPPYFVFPYPEYLILFLTQLKIASAFERLVVQPFVI